MSLGMPGGVAPSQGRTLSLLLLLALVGCEGAPQVSATVTVGSASAWDEAVTVPIEDLETPYSADVHPVGPDTVVYGRIADVHGLEDRVFVLDGLARAVIGLDTVTGEVMRFGRHGDGPQEFNRPAAINVIGDEVFVFDPGSVRLLVLGVEDLAHRRTWTVEGARFLNVPQTVGWMGPMRPVVRSVQFSPGRTEMKPQVARVVRVDFERAGELEIGRFPDGSLGFHPDGDLVVGPILGPRLRSAAASPNLLMIRDAGPEVQLVDSAGAVVGRWVFDLGPLEIDPPRELLEQYYLDTYGDDAESRRFTARMPVTDTLPTFDEITEIHAGEVLVRRLRLVDLPSADHRTWFQLCLEAPSVRAVSVPSAFQPRRRTGDVVYGIWTDSLGVTSPARIALPSC